MNFAARFWPSKQERIEKQAQRRLWEALKALDAPIRARKPGEFVGEVGVECGYPVRIRTLVNGPWVTMTTSAPIYFTREGIPRELLLAALDQNQKLYYGSFLLVEVGTEITLAQGQACDTRLFEGPLLAGIVAALVLQMKEMIQRLYAQDLIDFGPECSACSVGR